MLKFLSGLKFIYGKLSGLSVLATRQEVQGQTVQNQGMAANQDQQIDPEMREFIMMEQQKAQLQGTIHQMTDTCWEMCIDKPRDKMDYRTEQCISNCVDRFIDTTLQITQRFQQMLSRAGGH